MKIGWAVRLGGGRIGQIDSRLGGETGRWGWEVTVGGGNGRRPWEVGQGGVTWEWEVGR